MNKKGKSLLIVGILFVVMSMLLTIHFEYEQVYSKIKSDDTMKQILNKTIDNKENIKTIEINGLEYIGYHFEIDFDSRRNDPEQGAFKNRDFLYESIMKEIITKNSNLETEETKGKK